MARQGGDEETRCHGFHLEDGRFFWGVYLRRVVTREKHRHPVPAAS